MVEVHNWHDESLLLLSFMPYLDRKTPLRNIFHSPGPSSVYQMRKMQVTHRRRLIEETGYGWMVGKYMICLSSPSGFGLLNEYYSRDLWWRNTCILGIRSIQLPRGFLIAKEYGKKTRWWVGCWSLLDGAFLYIYIYIHTLHHAHTLDTGDRVVVNTWPSCLIVELGWLILLINLLFMG